MLVGPNGWGAMPHAEPAKRKVKRRGIVFGNRQADIGVPEPRRRSLLDVLLWLKFRPLSIPEATVPLTRIAREILEKNGIDKPVEIRIVKGDKYNAGAAPKGLIVIHLEALRKAKSPEELIFLLAHELSHVQYDDAKARRRRYIIASFISQLGETLIRQKTEKTKDPVIRNTALTTFSIVIKRWFNATQRKREARADLNAVRLLAKAGYSFMGYKDLFANLKTERKKWTFEQKLYLKIYSSDHPALGARKKALDDMVLLHPHFKPDSSMPPKEWQQMKKAALAYPMR